MANLPIASGDGSGDIPLPIAMAPHVAAEDVPVEVDISIKYSSRLH